MVSVETFEIKALQGISNVNQRGLESVEGTMRLLYLPNQYSQQRQKEKPAWVYPVLMAMQVEWHKKHGHHVDWMKSDGGRYDRVITEPQALPFLELPAPDRVFTNAFDKKYQKYGNYKYLPATHMQVANGCWHGKCSFCIENKNKYEVRQLTWVFQEIEKCHKLGFREIFDDSGTFPTGEWLKWFCLWNMTSPYDIKFGCNMRIGADVDFKMMKQAGFRMLLYGIESANQYTLDKINKGVNADEIIPTLKRASEAGLEPHVCIIAGFPWESEAEERTTYDLVTFLLRKGYAKTAQVSIYDVAGATKIDRKSTFRIYSCAKYPDFWIRKARDLRNWSDFLYLLKSIRKGIIRD